MQAMESGCKYRWSFVHWPATHFLLCSPITIRPRSVLVHGLRVVDPAVAGRESHFTSDELISKLASCHLQLWLSQAGPGHLCARQGLISFHGTCFYPQRKKESEVAQSCPTLCSLMDCSLPGCSVHGIFQARVLEWVAISFSRESSQAQGSNLGLPHCRKTLYHLSHQGRCFKTDPRRRIRGQGSPWRWNICSAECSSQAVRLGLEPTSGWCCGLLLSSDELQVDKSRSWDWHGPLWELEQVGAFSLQYSFLPVPPVLLQIKKMDDEVSVSRNILKEIRERPRGT